MDKFQRIKHGGRAVEAARRWNIPLDKILDFSSNANPLGYSKRIRQLNLSEFKLNMFPDDSYAELISAIADRFRCSGNNVLVGNGSTEIIRIIANCFIRKGTKVAIPENTYEEYRYSAGLFDGEVVNLDFNSESDVAFLCNPNNPTGEVISRNKIIDFLEGYKGLLVLDESYIEFLEEEERYTLSDHIDRKNIIVLRSLSKFYALPGIRLGYCLANEEIIKKLERYRISWNINSIAARMGVIALKDKEFVVESKEYIKKEREFFYSRLLKDGIRANNSLTNFFLIKVKDSKKMAEELEKKGILVRECSSFGLENCIRVSLRKREENKELMMDFLSFRDYNRKVFQ